MHNLARRTGVMARALYSRVLRRICDENCILANLGPQGRGLMLSMQNHRNPGQRDVRSAAIAARSHQWGRLVACLIAVSILWAWASPPAAAQSADVCKKLDTALE